MKNLELQGVEDAKPPGIPQLLDDYRHQQDALCEHADEVARLLGQVLAAVDREGVAIVSRARSEVRRIIMNARRDVLGLRGQLEAMGNGDASDADVSRTRDRLIETRRELREVLDEGRADLEALEKDAAAARPVVPPPTMAARAVTSDTCLLSAEPPRPARQLTACPTTAERPIQPETAQSETEPAPRRPSPALAVAVALFSGIAAIVVLGTIWWVARGNVRPTPVRGTVAATIAHTLAAGSRGAASTASSSVSSSSAAVSTAIAPHPLSVLVVAVRSVWVRVTTDGHSDAGRTYPAGETRTITADHEVSLRVGDAGAVAVAVDSGAREILGPDGEVATRHFAAKPAAPDRPAVRVAAAADHSSPALAPPDGAPRPSGGASALIVAGHGSIAAAANPVAAAGTRTMDPGPNARADLATRAQQWLDAYDHGDSSTVTSMPLAETHVSDERTSDERLPPGLAVRHSLEGLTFQFVNETAILSGKMIELAEAAGQTQRRVSWISQMWTRKSGQWRLMDVRMVDESRVK